MWLAFVPLIYYYAHKPFSNDLAANLGGAVLDTLSVVLLCLTAAGIGRTLHRRWQFFDAFSIGERLALEALGGFGILALLILLVGLINLSIISISVLILLCIGLTWRDIRSWAVDGWGWVQTWQPKTNWERGLTLFIGINLGLAYITALAPPTAFDALTYHLVGPKLWLAEGRFVSLPDNHFFAFPAFTHTLFSGQMALTAGRITGAALLQMVITLLGVVMFASYAARRFSSMVGLVSAAFFLTATSFWIFLSWPYVDLVVMSYSVVAVIALDEWRVHKSMPWLVLAGIFIGLTLSSKYNAFAFAIIAGLYVVNYSWSDGISTVVRNGAILTGIALIMLAPWLIRTFVFYDNPIYPFGPTTGQWDELSNEFYFPDNSEFIGKRWWILAFLPLTLTVIGIGGTDIFDATVGPLYLLLIPFLLLTWSSFNDEQRKRLKGLLLFVLMGCVLWLGFALQSRYALQVRLVIYLFPWLTILAAISFEQLKQLPDKPLNIAFMLRTLVAIVIVMTLVDHFAGTRAEEGSDTIEGTTTMSHFVERRALEYLLGVMDETAYVEHNLGWYSRAIDAVNNLDDDANVLFLWETRTLYCNEPDIRCEEDTILMRWWHDRRNIDDGSAQAILDAWQARGINHILVWEDGRDFEFDNNALFTDADKTEFDALIQLLEMVWQGEDIYTLYRIPTDVAN